MRCERVAATGRSRSSASSAPRNTSTDRKSTRLNSSHGYISYAVFCLKKKKKVSDYLDAALTQPHHYHLPPYGDLSPASRLCESAHRRVKHLVPRCGNATDNIGRSRQ